MDDDSAAFDSFAMPTTPTTPHGTVPTGWIVPQAVLDNAKPVLRTQLAQHELAGAFYERELRPGHAAARVQDGRERHGRTLALVFRSELGCAYAQVQCEALPVIVTRDCKFWHAR